MTAYRNDVDALANRHASLEQELLTKTREVTEAAQMLAEAQASAKRRVLDNIRVASPCPMKWENMTGDERVRACVKCEKNVFNLSDLTREEAEALIVEKEGKLCVRYYQRKDGTILLRDCSVGVRAKRRRGVIAAGAALLLGGAALFAFRASPSIGGALKAQILPTPDHEAIAGGIGPADPGILVEEHETIEGAMPDNPELEELEARKEELAAQKAELAAKRAELAAKRAELAKLKAAKTHAKKVAK